MYAMGQRMKEKGAYRARNHQRPAKARVHVGNDGYGTVERGDHGRVAYHVVGRGEPEVRLT